MTIEVKLSDDLQTRVEAHAAASGRPVAEWLKDVIEQAAPPFVERLIDSRTLRRLGPRGRHQRSRGTQPTTEGV